MIGLWITLSAVFLIASAENVRLLDLPPDQAQQIIDTKDQSLKYAPKIESNVPALRYIGNERQHVLEDVYLANQYHGQDGIGGYLYGYSVPDIAKTEKKKASGDLRGAYQYINGGGQEIKVEYWDNGNGFHQVDNVPQILPKQIDDAPAVKAAKEAHLKRWKEEAERNSRPAAYPYNGNQYKDQYQQPNINNIDYSGQYSENRQNYESNPTPPPREWEYQPTEEEKGPPRGFFYNFDYPVGIIVNKQGNDYQKRELEQLYNQNRASFDSQLKNRQGTNGASSSYQVHV